MISYLASAAIGWLIIGMIYATIRLFTD